MPGNYLYYGDNLNILRQYIDDESVDLVYLDPPFKSNQDYNILFTEQDGTRAASQIKAFEDTWTWDQASSAAYQETVEAGGQVSRAMQAFYSLLGGSDTMAYLSMLAPRLVELRRVLKPTGSIYLHCDPAASHYIKLLMDAIFDSRNFRNEIVWKRTSAHNDPKKWGRVHDIIFFYTKSENYTWNLVHQSYDEQYLKNKYRYEDERGRYRLSDLTGAGVTKEGTSSKPWRDFDPSKIGRHWAIPTEIIESLVTPEIAKQMTAQQKLDILAENGYIYMTPRGRKGGVGFPQLKRHIGAGVPIQDFIEDIPPINSMAIERLRYPTQKPEPLLERIIRASSNEGDVVLDPFCGCGTAIAVAQSLNRHWIGIDITHLAIGLIILICNWM